MARGKTTYVVFPVATPAGNGFAAVDKRDASRVLEERNPDYGRKIGASPSRPREFPIPWEDARRYIASPYRTREEVHRWVEYHHEGAKIEDVG